MKILIIGESCIDEYVFGTCDRVCPEAAAICFKSNGQIKSNLGMAGNVYNNIRTLRPEYQIDVITNTSSSIIKRRFIDTRYNTIVFRNDINDFCDRVDLSLSKLDNYDAVVISDYCKGFLTEDDIAYILNSLDNKTISVLDTKKEIMDFIKGITFLKINHQEFKEHIKDLNKVRNLCDIIVTKGEQGALFINNESETVYPTQKIDVRDVCGAGDTFLAGFVVKYLETHNVSLSIEYANNCASNVVSKFGVCIP